MKHGIFLILLLSFNSALVQAQWALEDTVPSNQKHGEVVDDLVDIDAIYLKKRMALTQQQNWIKMGFTLSSLLLFSGTLFLLWKQNQLKQQFEMQAAKEELLHLQMNPHFLFNALSSIQSLLFDQQDKILALQYLSKFAHLMRVVLANAQETQVAVASEVQMLEHYLAIQQLRFEHLFDFEIEVAPPILAWKTFIPPFLVQPFIESAIEQGLFHKVKNAWIKIQIKKEKGLILLIIKDNGWQFSTKAGATKEPSPISITQQRLKIINKIWRKPIQFSQIVKTGKSGAIIFKIPV